VSSDSTEEQMLGYKPTVFPHIPFDSQDRADLKLHFSTAAKKEMQDLGMTDRKHGTPTLILIDTAKERILTEDGCDTFMNGESPEQVLQAWRKLLEEAA
jgi:hypothetical protein